MAKAGTPLEVTARRLAAIFLAAEERIEAEKRAVAAVAKDEAAA